MTDKTNTKPTYTKAELDKARKMLMEAEFEAKAIAQLEEEAAQKAFEEDQKRLAKEREEAAQRKAEADAAHEAWKSEYQNKVNALAEEMRTSYPRKGSLKLRDSLQLMSSAAFSLRSL